VTFISLLNISHCCIFTPCIDQSENSTVTVPPLIKEQPTTHLVSDPELTSTWERPGKNNLNITENIRKNQGQNSTPTSSPPGVTMTVETMTLNVTCE